MTEPTRTTYHHGDLRRALLERSTEVIAADGIEALSLRSLARDLGVSHSAPNRHFPTKAHLLAGLVSHGYLQLRDACLTALDNAPDNPEERLRAIGRALVHWAVDNRALFRTTLHPDVQRHADDELRNIIHDFYRLVVGLTRDAQESGRLADDDTPMAALFTAAVPYGAALLLTDTVIGDALGVEPDDATIDRLVDLVIAVR